MPRWLHNPARAEAKSKKYRDQRNPAQILTVQHSCRAARCSAGTAITMLAAMTLAAAGFGQSPRLVSRGGLFQRASIIFGFAWLTALSARALHTTYP
jgi:hypothetical protein